MENLVINTNKFLKDNKKRRRDILKSQIVSFKLEGININSEVAKKIAKKVENKIKELS